MASRAEELGYGGVWVADSHSVMRGAYEILAGSEIRLGLAQYLFFADKHAFFQVGLDYLMYSGDKSIGGVSYDHTTNRILARLYLGFVVALDLSAQVEIRNFDSAGFDKETITTLGRKPCSAPIW